MFILYCFIFWIVCVIFFKDKTITEIKAEAKAENDRRYASWAEANPEAVKTQAALDAKNKAHVVALAEARAPLFKAWTEARVAKDNAEAAARGVASTFAKIKAVKFAVSEKEYDYWKAQVKAAKAEAQRAKAAFVHAENALKPYDGLNEPHLLA